MLSVFFSSKCSLFHNSNVFGSCIIHILYTGCNEIKKNNSGAKSLICIETVELLTTMAFSGREHAEQTARGQANETS